MKSDAIKISAVLRDSEIIIYQLIDGVLEIDIWMQGETSWFSKNKIAELIRRDCSIIGKHIHNIIVEGELDEKSSGQKMPVPSSDEPETFYLLEVVPAGAHHIIIPML